MLLYMAAVLTIIGEYCTELRGYPRIVAGWIIVPTSVAMATTTFLTTWFHSRSLRHVWLVVGMIGCSVTVWWLSSIDNFTAKEHLAFMLACWGAFLGLIPPVFLMDEVEGLDPKHMLYGFALGLVGLLVRSSRCRLQRGRSSKPGPTGAGRVSPQYPRKPAGCRAVCRSSRGLFPPAGLSGPRLQQETAEFSAVSRRSRRLPMGSVAACGS